MKSPQITRRQPSLYQAGVTLLEALTASVFIGILAIIGSNIVSDSMVLSKRAITQNLNSSAYRYAIDRMSREIREISAEGGKQVTTMGPQSLVFLSASTQAENGLNDKTRTEFSYNSANKTLSMRQGDALAAPLLENVISLTFSYYDKTGAVTTVAKSLHSIGIVMQTRDVDSPAIPIATRITLRN